jgi:hypothetical protein
MQYYWTRKVPNDTVKYHASPNLRHVEPRIRDFVSNQKNLDVIKLEKRIDEYGGEGSGGIRQRRTVQTTDKEGETSRNRSGNIRDALESRKHFPFSMISR